MKISGNAMSCITRLIVFGGLLIFGMETAAANLYRYKNDQGVVVLDYTIPKRYIDKGYSILDEKGRVIEEVPAKPTEAELKKSALDRQAREEAERLKQRDEWLLKSYSTVADIEARRDRRVSEINVRLTILKGNITALKARLESLQAEAADIERQGQEVPKVLSGSIQGLRKEIDVSNDLMAQRQTEKAEVEEQFARDMERFNALFEQAEKRRNIYRPQ